jgi:hypothetical protein
MHLEPGSGPEGDVTCRIKKTIVSKAEASKAVEVTNKVAVSRMASRAAASRAGRVDNQAAVSRAGKRAVGNKAVGNKAVGNKAVGNKAVGTDLKGAENLFLPFFVHHISTAIK